MSFILLNHSKRDFMNGDLSNNIFHSFFRKEIKILTQYIAFRLYLFFKIHRAYADDDGVTPYIHVFIYHIPFSWKDTDK